MQTLAPILVGFVAAQHFFFLVLEMFLWQKPLGRKIFRLSAEHATLTAPLAKNQGIYNGFLAAGLVWSLLPQAAAFATPLQYFFLGCVVVAAIVGAATVSPRILIVQGVPAALGLAALALG